MMQPNGKPKTRKPVLSKPMLRKNAQRGFTIVETMIAIAILSFGILTLLATFSTAVGATQNAQSNLIARQKALQAMESIYTARNSQQITFSQIANISSGGIFTSGATQLLFAGPDGLVNTADDTNFPASGACPAGPEGLTLPGPDGILGTADDTCMSLANFTRQITINSVLESDGVTLNPNLRQINVTVSYSTGNYGKSRSYTVYALISSFH
jgi:prepilin-type N-terminal cleavage/methylation domain-containing protein